MSAHRFEVRLRDRRTRLPLDEKVQAHLVWSEERAPLDFDPIARTFFRDVLAPGRYGLEVTSQPAGEPEVLPVRVGSAPTKLTLWSGSAPVPAVEDPATGLGPLLGILPTSSAFRDRDALDRLTALATEKLDLQVIRGWGNGRTRGFRRRLAVFAVKHQSGAADADAVRAGRIVAELLDNRALVAAAGPFVGDPHTTVGLVWSQWVYLQLAEGASALEARKLSKPHELSWVKQLPIGEDLFIAGVAPERSFMLAEILAQLRSHPRVRRVEVVPVTEAEGNGSGSPGAALWDRQLARIEEARALIDSSAEPALIAIVDREWLPGRQLRSHPELAGPRRSRVSRRVDAVAFDRQDVRPLPLGGPGEVEDEEAEGDESPEPHALMCAAIAAGRITGVARRSRLVVLKDPHHDWLHLRAWLWAAGWPSLGMGRRPPARKGADVFSASITRPEGVTETGAEALRLLVVAGRRGRGCPLFFAAGNAESDIGEDRGYASLPFTLAITASTLDERGEETFASYSGWGDEVELCAPSGSADGVGDSGGPFDGVLAADAPHLGGYPFEALVDTRTTGVATALDGESETLRVESVAGLVENGHVTLVTGDGQWESRQLYNARKGELTLQRGTVPLPPGSRVISATFALGRLAAVQPTSDHLLELQDLPTVALAAGQRFSVGLPASPSSREYTLRAVAGKQIRVKERLSAHGVEDWVYLDESHWSMSGGTSTSTPLCAGTAALMLEANPRLSWVEVRQILRETAVKIDLEHDDEPGRWADRDGIPFSQRYGYGRLDAAAAVERALAYDFPRDLMIRQSEQDDGEPRSAPPENSPDIWFGDEDPRSVAAGKVAGAPSYGPVVRSRGCWLHARVRNRGAVDSLKAWVRFYVAAGQREPYRFPDDFEFARARVLAPGRWRRGTRFLDEAPIDKLPPGESQTVAVQWIPALIPPKLDSFRRRWHPHILVAISPLDGRGDGVTMLDCNNLAQRAVEILDE